MKWVILLLFFSSFLYAQDNPQGEAENTPQQQEKPQTPPEQSPNPDSAEKKKENPPAGTQKPNAGKQAQKTASNQKSDSEEQEQEKPPADTSEPNAEKKTPPVIQKTVAVPQKALEAPPEEPIPYYNPLHPQSPSTYKEGDLPSESLSNMTAHKSRKHRFSVGGKLLDYHIQGSLKKINVNVLADYGYSRKYFEVGPYASLALNDFEIGQRRFQEELMLEAGAFFEVHFKSNTSHAKNIPSIGLKAGYKRKENVGYMTGQLYVTMKFFLNRQTAFFASLGPYYQYKFKGQKGEWGVEIPTGLRFYFY